MNLHLFITLILKLLSENIKKEISWHFKNWYKLCFQQKLTLDMQKVLSLNFPTLNYLYWKAVHSRKYAKYFIIEFSKTVLWGMKTALNNINDKDKIRNKNRYDTYNDNFLCHGKILLKSKKNCFHRQYLLKTSILNEQSTATLALLGRIMDCTLRNPEYLHKSSDIRDRSTRQEIRRSLLYVISCKQSHSLVVIAETISLWLLICVY